mmetsp:Transcript_98593/g.301685  ORF Transcript_98593/g.301685 Transcript_98593/m.301685 type:complete len:263 (+) Transcript_98593:317-1105(+)
MRRGGGRHAHRRDVGPRAVGRERRAWPRKATDRGRRQRGHADRRPHGGRGHVGRGRAHRRAHVCGRTRLVRRVAARRRGRDRRHQGARSGGWPRAARRLRRRCGAGLLVHVRITVLVGTHEDLDLVGVGKLGPAAAQLLPQRGVVLFGQVLRQRASLTDVLRGPLAQARLLLRNTHGLQPAVLLVGVVEGNAALFGHMVQRGRESHRVEVVRGVVLADPGQVVCHRLAHRAVHNDEAPRAADLGVVLPLYLDLVPVNLVHTA